jgi:hypothetical protein
MQKYYGNIKGKIYSGCTKLMQVQALDIYKIHVSFDDWVEWDIDLIPQSDSSVFLQLEENDIRKYPQITENGDAIFRNDNLDIDATACYINITGKNPTI